MKKRFFPPFGLVKSRWSQQHKSTDVCHASLCGNILGPKKYINKPSSCWTWFILRWTEVYTQALLMPSGEKNHTMIEVFFMNSSNFYNISHSCQTCFNIYILPVFVIPAQWSSYRVSALRLVDCLINPLVRLYKTLIKKKNGIHSRHTVLKFGSPFQSVKKPDNKS